MIDKWVSVNRNSQHRKNTPTELPATILEKLNRSSSEIDVSFKYFIEVYFLDFYKN